MRTREHKSRKVIYEFDRNTDRFVSGYLKLKGCSINEIAHVVGTPRSTIHSWVADVHDKKNLEALQSGDDGLVLPTGNMEVTKKFEYGLDNGSAIRLMNSEAQFVALYGKDLIRKHKGCDFRDPDSETLIEIKTGVLSNEQAAEMVSEFYDDDRRGLLAIIKGESALIFRLETILVAKEPEPPTPSVTEAETENIAK